MRLKASEVVAMGRKYKNYQEKRKMGTRAQLWDFHWAAGNKNYTIWAELYKDYCGANYQGQAWCAMFGTDIVALAFIEKFGVSDKEAARLTREFYGGDMPYNCQVFVNNHKRETNRLNNTPKVGSAVIFHTGSKYGHWGTVTGVDADGKGFTSVEGNTSGGYDKVDPDGGAVVEKWHKNTSKTLFWHPDYESEEDRADLITYPIKSVGDGLKVKASALNVRDYPVDGKIVASYNNGAIVFPKEKCFIEGKPWYRTDKGWFSAKYLEGWVQENDGGWWYMHEGYAFTTKDWEKIDGEWYYMDDSGYIIVSNWVEDKDIPGKYYYLDKEGKMAKNTYIKSLDNDDYYWVGEDGAWYEPEYFTTKNPNLDKYSVTI